MVRLLYYKDRIPYFIVQFNDSITAEDEIIPTRMLS